jgi:hypothetical protein
MPNKKDKKSKRRSGKKIMHGCSYKKRKTIRGGNFETPLFRMPISKFYPMNELSNDVQRNSAFDIGVTTGGSKKRRYSRKYLDKHLRGGSLLSLAPSEYKPIVNMANPNSQPIAYKYSDTNPYLV